MSTTIVHPNVSEFNALLSGDKPVLVDFWADWCMPCKMLGPVIEQLGEKYTGKVTIAKVNIDEQSELATRYRVQSIPTVMIFNKGELVDTQVGLRSEDVYSGILDSLI